MERRQVDEAHLTVCTSGHVVASEPTGRKVWQILHTCGVWTFEDSNFCGGCGEKLKKEEEE